MYNSGQSPKIGAPDVMDVTDRKRKRLTFACNACRARKIKCDDRQPRCSNCFKADVPCETTDPRQNGKLAWRKQAQPHRTKSKTKISTPLHISSPTVNQLAEQTAVSNLSAARSVPNDNFRRSEGSEVSHAQPPELANHEAPLPALPRFLSGNSLQILTQWLDLAFARIGVKHRFYNRFFISRLRKEPSPLMSLAGQIPTRPMLASETGNHINSYLQSTNVIYPIFEEFRIRSIMDTYLQSQTENNVCEGSPSLSAIAILVDVIGEISQPTSNSVIKQRSRKKLVAAYSLLAMIVAENSLCSVQAMLLLVIVLRGYNEIEIAWHIITLAASMAQTLGLNRALDQSCQQNGRDTASEESVRTWWVLYCLEKVLSLETERQSSIKGSDSNQARPKIQQDPPVFESIINLAVIQSQIGERCISARLSEENNGIAYSDIINEKLRNCGELDQMLLTWADGLPMPLRPMNYLFCPRELLPCVSFLAIQYYQTLVLIHRNNVLVNAELARREIDFFCANEPYIHRLRMGKVICNDAARSTVHVLENVLSNGADSILNSINAPLIATYALAIHLLKNPMSGLAKSDLELQMRAIRFVQSQRRLIADEDGVQGDLLDALHREVSDQVHKAVESLAFSAGTEDRDSVQQVSKTSQQESFGSIHAFDFEPIRALQHSPIEQADEVGDCPTHVSGPASTDTFALGLLDQTPTQKDVYRDLEFEQLDMDWDALSLMLDLPNERQG